jgi:hypothetical protein
MLVLDVRLGRKLPGYIHGQNEDMPLVVRLGQNGHATAAEEAWSDDNMLLETLFNWVESGHGSMSRWHHLCFLCMFPKPILCALETCGYAIPLTSIFCQYHKGGCCAKCEELSFVNVVHSHSLAHSNCSGKGECNIECACS